MKENIIRYFKHLFGTIAVLLIIGIAIVLFLNGNVHYADNPAKKNWKNEGPYVFYDTDSLLGINYISGNKKEGFSSTQYKQKTSDSIKLKCYFNLDSSSFDFTIQTNTEIPKCIYNDGHKVMAISDIESGYKTFRDFLIHNKVINEKLEWTFGKGHLVLLGDFVDRGNSTTQVLWFIYMLEQKAEKYGGKVHYILGNHEIKNLQGNYAKASLKYFYAAAILGKQQYELFDSNAVLGRWMNSKNTLELINGHLFVHGGIAPKITTFNTNIAEINDIIRKNYRQAHYPKGVENLEQLLTSTTKGPSWYRGYFYDDLTEKEIEKGLHLFNAKAVVVGHTVQRKVKAMHKRKVFSIDVNHPKDYRKSFPFKPSEGLLIEGENYYRLLHDGKKIKL